MSFYTIIFEYKEGTYVSQVEALDEFDAFGLWAGELKIHEIQYFTEKLKLKLIEDSKYEDNKPVLLKGLKNVWCASCSFSGLINIIKTCN